MIMSVTDRGIIGPSSINVDMRLLYCQKMEESKRQCINK